MTDITINHFFVGSLAKTQKLSWFFLQVKGQASTMGWSWNSSPLDNGSTGCQHAWAHLWPCRRRWLPQGEHFQSDFSRLRKTLMIPWRRENGGASSSRPSSRSSWASSASSLSEPSPPSFAGRSVPKSKINDKTKKEKTTYMKDKEKGRGVLEEDRESFSDDKNPVTLFGSLLVKSWYSHVYHTMGELPEKGNSWRMLRSFDGTTIVYY